MYPENAPSHILPSNSAGKIFEMTIKSEPIRLCSWKFWNFLFSMRVANSEYSRILNFLTWHGFDEFSWNDPAIKLLPSYGAPENSRINRIEIEWKIVYSAKSNIEVSLKKFHALTLRVYFKNYTVWRECNALLCSHFWYHKFYFSNSPKFHWNSSSLSEDVSFHVFDFNCFYQFFWFSLTFTCYKKN